MNNDIIKQSFIESFEILKDSWDSKKKSIIKCIVETEACDGALAMDMWTYVLMQNANLLRDKTENISFIDEVILGFIKKYDNSADPGDICNTIIHHIAPHIVRNDTLINIIFGKLINAGYSKYNYSYDDDDPSELIPACIACIFMQDYPHAIPVLFKALSTNNNMEDISIGELILKANYYLDVMKRRDYMFDDFNISDDIKESLLSCIDCIKDCNDRAEITLSFMSR